MVFYGIGGSSVAFNGGVIRARSFEPSTANFTLELVDSGAYARYTSMSASAYDRKGNYLYSANITTSNSSLNLVIPPSGTVSLLRHRGDYERYLWNYSGMDLVRSSTYSEIVDDIYANVHYQSAVFSASEGCFTPSVTGSHLAQMNWYHASGTGPWTSIDSDSYPYKTAYNALSLTASSLPYMVVSGNYVRPKYYSSYNVTRRYALWDRVLMLTTVQGHSLDNFYYHAILEANRENQYGPTTLGTASLPPYNSGIGTGSASGSVVGVNKVMGLYNFCLVANKTGGVISYPTWYFSGAAI